jgi:hypothetical protein
MGDTTGTVVATTKLTIPSLRRALVPRPELSARLDEKDYRVALVAAPAGYGKTATLAAWAAQQPHELAWLSCDSSDAEPSRFMAGLLASISVKWPGVADDALVLLERGGAHTHDAAVAVANELASVKAPGVIVVDDLHLAKPAPELLSHFLEALPGPFRLVFGSRSDLPISMARLRVHGGLLELRSNDLRFSAPQLASSNSTVSSMRMNPRHHLHLTEGWPPPGTAPHRRRPDKPEAFAETDRAVGGRRRRGTRQLASRTSSIARHGCATLTRAGKGVRPQDGRVRIRGGSSSCRLRGWSVEPLSPSVRRALRARPPLETRGGGQFTAASEVLEAGNQHCNTHCAGRHGRGAACAQRDMSCRTPPWPSWRFARRRVPQTDRHHPGSWSFIKITITGPADATSG